MRGRSVKLTNGELLAIQHVVYEEVYYGDDSIVYAEPGTDAHVDALRAGLRSLDAEIKRRGI